MAITAPLAWDVFVSGHKRADQMLSIYPDRVNPGVVWISARTLKP